MADETRYPDMARGREGEVRVARPENAAQDPKAAARQAESQRNSDELRESARRVEASTPPASRDRTVHEMTREAERNAERSRS